MSEESPPQETTPAVLRRRAEDRLRATPPAALPRTAAETQRLLHELQVHQVELEMQNEELRRTRDALEASLERVTALYDFAPVGYVTLDRAGTIRSVNLAGAALLGGDRAGIVGMPFHRVLSPDTRPTFDAVLAAVFDGPGKGAGEMSILATAGPLRAVRLEATAAEGEEPCRAVLVDVTDRKRLEEERLLRTKLEATGILAAGIAHDFNNLLMVILGSLELLGEPGEDPAPPLAAATQATLEARGLTQQFLTFAKGGRPARKVLGVAGVVRDAATLALRGAPIACDVRHAGRSLVRRGGCGAVGTGGSEPRPERPGSDAHGWPDHHPGGERR